MLHTPLFVGLVRGFDRNKVFEMVGNFRNGFPHGPFWIGNVFQNNYTFMHFNNGKIINENVVLLNVNSNTGVMGNFANGSLLEQAHETPINWFGDYNCMKGNYTFCSENILKCK